MSDTLFDEPMPPGGAALDPSSQVGETLGERIRQLHVQICRQVPEVDRIACALYDPVSDMLKTFVNSTRHVEPLRAYQYRLSQSPTLLRLSQLRQDRAIADIPATLRDNSQHSRWVLAQGYQSSFTVPLYHQGAFEGFLFFDSTCPDVFTPAVTAQLAVYANLVALMISHEMTAIHALVGSVRIARDFAHLRDVETGAHLERMSRYARIIARGLAIRRDLSDEFIEQVFLFSPLHDIGKIGVPDALLRKPGRYTPEERVEMQSHVGKGVEIVERLIGDFQLGAVAGVRVLRRLVAHHHECLDGSGYPQGLEGDAIPIEARIVTVADIFDALSSRRVYKPAWGMQAACDELRTMADQGKIDADCVQALADARAEVAEIMVRHADADGMATV